MRKLLFWAAGSVFLLAILLSLSLSRKGSTRDLETAGVSDARGDTPREAFQMIDLPLEPPKTGLKPLITFTDPELTAALRGALRRDKKFDNLVRQKKLCLAVVDLTNPQMPRYASINGNTMLYAASLPKIAVLLAAQEGLEQGILKETPDLLRDMNRMIRYSDNMATTRVIDRLGYKQIESVLRSPRYRFYDETNGGGLWVGKRYAKSGKTNREPLRQLSHAATVYQVSRFYYQLVYGQLVSRERSRKMLQIMKDPGISHKFVHSLEKLDPEATLYRKSGSWRSWHADSVLVWDEDRRYILVALVEDAGGESIVRRLVEPVEKQLFK